MSKHIAALLCFSLASVSDAQVTDSLQVLTPAMIEAVPTVGTDAELEQYKDVVGSPFNTRKRRARLTIDALGMYDSNAIRNDLLMGLWRGGELSREVRELSQQELQGHNRAGYEGSFRASYTWGASLFGDKSMRPLVSVGYRDLMGMRFTDDLYNLTFFGNAAYEGKTAVLAPSAQEEQRYQTIGVGMKAANSESYFRLDLVNGQYLNAVHLQRADMFTAEDGRYIEAALDGTWSTSDTSGQRFSNGLGLGLSAGVQMNGRLFGRRLKVFLEVNDLGFIAWNGGSQRLVKNGIERYDGIYVDDIIDLDGSLVGEAQLLDTLELNTSAGGFLRPLPARVRASFSLLCRGCKFRSRPRPEQFMVEQLAVPGYILHMRYTHSIAIGRRWLGYGQLSYGGFGGVRLGAGAWGTYRWGTLKLELPNVVGLCLPGSKGKAASVGFVFDL